jgi:DNA-binding HxlR family transcriptional regulator
MDKTCTVFKTTSFIGKRWTLLILLELHKGERVWKRYTHLKNSLINITPKILSARLKELERENMIKRRVDAKNFPIKSEYRLTEGGQDFIRIIKNIKKWSLKWKFKSKRCESRDCKACRL